ncbi:MAG: RagB/SusD family nutrient uptake outer membrane protein [Bacteroidetes bacterium]|nr:RagB/SusD family nutrient uptake outer membrane protein [Bacteroidota bacterium]MBU1719609.1 RagB/SusD family nutrient uptake outer membrane protein [Bacteroidota bacterium]
MKTNNIITTAISATLITISVLSCKKALDIKQEMNIPNDQAITSVRDLENVATGAYDGLQSGNVMGGNLVVFADLLGDDAVVSTDQLYNFGTREIYDRATTVQITPLRDMWRDAYGVINRANNIIDIIDNNKLSGEDFDAAKDRLKGEALFIRGFVHFGIQRFWALPYDVDAQGANTQPGIPYRTLPTLSGMDPSQLEMPRNTVEQVYEYVIADLLAAEQLLTSAGVITCDEDVTGDSKYMYRSRASAMAAAAYLARVYFYKGDYINASLYAEKVISSNKYSLNTDLNEAFQTSGTSVTGEVIFQLMNTESDQSNAVAWSYAPSGGQKPLFMGSESLTGIFWDSKDKRRKSNNFISINPYTDETYVRKYVSRSPAYNICLLRLGEMHLIRAEANMSAGGNGDFTKASESYEAIRQRAYTTDYVPQTILLADYLDSVRVEHRREMCFEGDRYHNLKRMKQNINGLPYNDPSFLFKIPQEEMSGNSLMEQNP